MKTWTLFALAVFLLLGSTVGSSRAALSYYSENYQARIQTSNIGAVLTENEKESDGKLMAHIRSEESLENICPGRVYEERIGVCNTGSIDAYVRVILYRYWEDEDGNKRTDLPPELIRLNLTGSGWVEDLSASTEERMVLYYTDILKAGEHTPNLSDSLTIDPAVLSYVTKEIKEENGYVTVTTAYDYDRIQFVLKAETDAVQTHNAADAVRSAWGVNISTDGAGRLILSGQEERL